MEPSSLKNLHVTVSNQPIGKFESAPEKYTRLEAFSVHGGRVYAYVKRDPGAMPLEIEVIRQIVKGHLERLKPKAIEEELKLIVPIQANYNTQGPNAATRLIAASIQPATDFVNQEFRRKLLLWKSAVDSSRYVASDDFFPASNERAASSLDPIWNTMKLMTLSHQHQNNIVIGVGGLFNLDIALARIQANPGANFFLLVVDINSGYEMFWREICNVLKTTPQVEDARVAIRQVIDGFGGLWGGETRFHSYMLSSQNAWNDARKLALEEKILFSTLDMYSAQEAHKLREVIDSSGYFVDTYNVSNVAAVSELSSSSGVASLSRAAGELMMPGSLLIASKIYFGTIEADENLFRSGEGYCVQSVMSFESLEKLPEMLNNPQRFEKPEWFLQDVRLIIESEYSDVGSTLMQLSRKMPEELNIPLFKEIVYRAISAPTAGINQFIEMVAEGKGSLQEEKDNYQRAIRAAFKEIEQDKSLNRNQKDQLEVIKQKLLPGSSS